MNLLLFLLMRLVKSSIFMILSYIDIKCGRKTMNRGEIYYANLSPIIGRDQGGYRPVVILQNNKGNKYSTTVIVAPISSRLTKNPLPTHVMIETEFLKQKSVILLEQIRTIDKKRIDERVGILSDEVMRDVNMAIKTSLDIR